MKLIKHIFRFVWACIWPPVLIFTFMFWFPVLLLGAGVAELHSLWINTKELE